jgi:DNA modification methylase
MMPLMTTNKGGKMGGNSIGPYAINEVTGGDSLSLIPALPDESVDVVVTSPPYWGQRMSKGAGIEEHPRDYIEFLKNVFALLLPKLKESANVWINIGDAYNTPVNWRVDDRQFSTLGQKKRGLSDNNSAYTKPRVKRKAFIDKNIPWLSYGNLLALPYRLVIGLCDIGYLFRGEVIWNKRNPLPEGKCRRPHRKHESIYLLTKSEKHNFKLTPPVKTIWEFANEKISGRAHFSRFPLELPKRCIDAYGKKGEEIVILDPFSGSGTTGMAAKELNCSYIGFEIDEEQVYASNQRLKYYGIEQNLFPDYNNENASAAIL